MLKCIHIMNVSSSNIFISKTSFIGSFQTVGHKSNAKAETTKSARKSKKGSVAKVSSYYHNKNWSEEQIQKHRDQTRIRMHRYRVRKGVTRKVPKLKQNTGQKSKSRCKKEPAPKVYKEDSPFYVKRKWDEERRKKYREMCRLKQQRYRERKKLFEHTIPPTPEEVSERREKWRLSKRLFRSKKNEDTSVLVQNTRREEKDETNSSEIKTENDQDMVDTRVDEAEQNAVFDAEESEISNIALQVSDAEKGERREENIEMSVDHIKQESVGKDD